METPVSVGPLQHPAMRMRIELEASKAPIGELAGLAAPSGTSLTERELVAPDLPMVRELIADMRRDSIAELVEPYGRSLLLQLRDRHACSVARAAQRIGAHRRGPAPQRTAQTVYRPDRTPPDGTLPRGRDAGTWPVQHLAGRQSVRPGHRGAATSSPGHLPSRRSVDHVALCSTVCKLCMKIIPAGRFPFENLVYSMKGRSIELSICAEVFLLRQ